MVLFFFKNNNNNNLQISLSSRVRLFGKQQQHNLSYYFNFSMTNSLLVCHDSFRDIFNNFFAEGWLFLDIGWFVLFFYWIITM